MASIIKRGKTWRAQIIRKGYKAQHRTFDTKAEAETWAKTVESKMMRRVYRDNTAAFKLTFRDALGRYEREVTVNKKGARQERSRIARWKAHQLAARPLGSLGSDDFAKYRDEMRKAGKADSTIRLDLAVVSHLFTVARQEWTFSGLANPLDSMTKPATSRKRERRVSDAEIQAIIAASGSDVLPAVLQLAIETAMRRSELVTSLLWKHIDLDARVAHLPDTKPDAPRNVPLSTVAIELLRSLPGDRKGKVFKVAPDSITQAFIRARKRARTRYLQECEERGEEADPDFLVNVRFHDSRHEATSTLFEKGFNPMEAAAVTGHSDLKTLMRYTHLDASRLAQRLDRHGQTDDITDHPHPGAKLREYLPNSSKIALVAKQIGISKRELTEVVAGRARIDAELAVRMEVLGPRAELWAEMQLAHDLQEVRRRREAAETARKPRKSAAGAAQPDAG